MGEEGTILVLHEYGKGPDMHQRYLLRTFETCVALGQTYLHGSSLLGPKFVLVTGPQSQALAASQSDWGHVTTPA